MSEQIRNDIIYRLESVKMILNNIEISNKSETVLICIDKLEHVILLCKEQFSEKNSKHYEKIIEIVIKKIKLLINNIETYKIISLGIDIIIKQVKVDREIKKEILFLPYKVSMWDSLESIWQAANNDKEYCQAFVVPIPYGDRNPDGTASQWHCEKNKFPDYVPTVDFNDYDIAKRRPDIIYIHNPYDEYNSATSVDSRYYSYELKKYTNMLIYVPYFVVGSAWPEIHRNLSCYKSVDKIIIQHEDIKVIGDNISENKKKTLYDIWPKEKIAALGSPKFDYVMKCQKNKEIPLKWTKTIDGRKVFFYNTSLTGILTSEEFAITKMVSIFNYFKEHREFCLIWRPHPLMENTLKAVSVDLYEKYVLLKKKFIINKLGIFDNTPDIGKSIAVADAYIGEGSSSIVHLFGVTGKPIFTTNIFVIKIPSYAEASAMAFNSMYINKNNIYFVASCYNMLCKYDLNKMEISCLKQFKRSPFADGLLINNGEKLIFPQINQNEVLEYSIKKRKIDRLFTVDSPMNYGNFCNVVNYKESMFFIPYRYPAIIQYNRNTKKTIYFKECMTEILQYNNSGKKSEIFIGHTVRDNKLLLPLVQANKVLEFNMDNGEYIIHTLSEAYGGHRDIIQDGDCYWLIPWEIGPIIKWNYITHYSQIYNEYPKNFLCGMLWNQNMQLPFMKAIKINNTIWLFPWCANMILCVDCITGKIYKPDLQLPYKEGGRKSIFYLQQPNYFCVEKLGQ